VAPNVIDLLAEQPEAYLQKMLAGVREDLARLTVEAQQIEEALAKKSRRGRTGGGNLTREQVYGLVVSAGQPVAPADVYELVAKSGITASLNAVRNHLARLADKDHRLQRTLDGRFAAPFGAHANEESADTETDLDIPF
jgi:hypothetical protein